MAFAYQVKGRKLELLSQNLSGQYVTPKTSDAKPDGLKLEYTKRADFYVQATKTIVIDFTGTTVGAMAAINIDGVITNLLQSTNIPDMLDTFIETTPTLYPGMVFTKTGPGNKYLSIVGKPGHAFTLTIGELIADVVTTEYIINDGTSISVTGDLSLVTEHSMIDIPTQLQKALVDYIKARMAEDQGEIQMKEYFMHEFQKKIDTYEETKTHGVSQTMVGHWGIK